MEAIARFVDWFDDHVVRHCSWRFCEVSIWFWEKYVPLERR